MKFVSQILIVLGFCVAAIGAAGFDKELEPNAVPLFAGGIVALAVGAFLGKMGASKQSEATEGSAHAIQLNAQVAAIRDIVVELDQQKAELAPTDLCDRIDNLLRNEYFDLASRNEEIANALGFTDYAKVWDGVAIAERSLARVWSISTDGHHAEALESLPEARSHIERAASAAASLG